MTEAFPNAQARRARQAELKRDLEFEDTLAGEHLRFRTTWGLFSPRRIDDGTRMLLERIEVHPADACLDLGCGYGPIGLTLARKAPQGLTTLVDTNYLAVEYSQRNAELNGIANVECLTSNGFSRIRDRRFDLVTSNLPAKVGREMLQTYLLDAHEQMNPGGRIYVVTITGLRRFIEKGFKDVFGNYDKVKQGREYTVAAAVREPD
ncbi:class I SAM-dependent methyltransferase [Thioalkalivibrio sp. ALE17]|uniref:class I SAM-dependent methyltransferase n=1 Tax=Thioalkalivibrio sp. ALE17 TaxID=1158173 RepID=UPI0003FDEFA2|nr:methyltransferase [Thioalkalivibrio sp. ALE17]